MNPHELELLFQTLSPADTSAPYIERLLSPNWTTEVQRKFILDPSRRKAVLSGRRNGKTFGFARQLYLTALAKPGSSSLYVALTRTSAKDIIWLELLDLLNKLDLPAEIHHTELKITLPNQSVIRITGCSDSSDLARFRGVANDLVILDETQDWADFLEDFIRKVIEPTLVDRQGTLCIGGTPNEKLYGYFWKVTTGRMLGWSQHQYSIFSNTFFGKPPSARVWTVEQANARATQELESAKTERGLTEDHPIYITEYLGQWPTTSSHILYADFCSANLIPAEPVGWERGFLTLGMDLGFMDHTAFVLYAQSPDNRLTIIKSWSRPGMVLEQIVIQLRQHLAKYPDIRFVVDYANKQLCESITQSYQIALEPAKKEDKKGGIALLNSDLRTRNISIVEPGNEALIEQLKHLEWDKDRQKEAEGQPADLCDAFLYGYRSYLVDNMPLQTEKALTKTGPMLNINPDEGIEYWQKRINKATQEEDYPAFTQDGDAINGRY